MFRTADAKQNSSRLLVFALFNEPARTFRNWNEQGQKNKCRHDFSREHPAPARRSIPGRVALLLDPLVDEEGQKNTGDNAQLKKRTQPAPPFRGRNFRDVNRADHGRNADGNPAEEARRNELRKGLRNRRKDRGKRVQERAEKQHAPSPEFVAEKTGKKSTRNTSVNRGSRRQTNPGGILFRVQGEM